MWRYRDICLENICNFYIMVLVNNMRVQRGRLLMVTLAFVVFLAMFYLGLLFYYFLSIGPTRVCLADVEEDAKHYLERVNKLYADKTYETTLVEWAHATNITNETLAKKVAISSEYAKFAKAQWLETIRFPWKTFKDEDVKRQFKKFSVLGNAALPDDKYEKLVKLIADMESIYSKAKICDFYNKTKCDLSLEPEITKILATSRNESELKHAWTEWRKKTGKPIRPLFGQYVAIMNEAARSNNFSNGADYWLDSYDTPNFTDQVATLWDQLKPLYYEIHAYVRRKLREKYGDSIVSKRGPIPAHLLGNMWSQSWSNVADLAKPYKDAYSEDVTKYLVEQGYTPLKMFKLAEEFFKSINLTKMPEEFWKYSVIEKPSDRDIICHASAWDFGNGKDFRIKQCTSVDAEDLETAHHEMGHIEYYLQYKDQPYIYREGANPGFHEAIGDTIALSVNTPEHLNKIGLLPSVSSSKESDLNNLFSVAMDKIVFLPFAYLLDLWRWNVFKGAIKEENYNCEWWKLRTQYQGITPPDERSEDDFDPASKYHVVSSTPYIRYFVSYVIQFQFHEALCIKAGQYDPENPKSRPLHQCDIYKSTEAGNLLKDMLELGSSKPWPDAMEVITGQRNMDAQALVRYFTPMYEWLKEENKRSGEYVGWDVPKKVCRSRKFQIGNFLRKVARNVKNIFTTGSQ